MDKGTHFYRCDFQAHTPRDINWKGVKPVTDEDRQIFAKKFVSACREKGLNAVAITDHHDFTFFKYMKQAAGEEFDQEGKLYLAEKQLVVFPGLELTLSTPPCQCLLILDANFPEDQFTRILYKLSIEPNGHQEASTAVTNPISTDVIKDLIDLHIKLDTIDTLKGKYLILPNVSDNGHKTLLRSGFAEYYSKMPCVGAYIDGSVSSLGRGNTNIVNGRDANYGNKSVALFQTSDNRIDTFADLATHSTWVKWSEPTAEGLRQACLAKESRLCQSVPELPQIVITNLDVTSSKFLSSFSFDFNSQYNALIGGRGTGKSTVLEYLRWGLCDQPAFSSDPQEQSDLERRRQLLIENTLVPFNGEVRITFILNGITHIVKRNSVTKEILLKIGEGDFQQVKEDDIRRILPIQAYSQKQLSNVAIKTDELKRFIQQPIALQLSNLKFQVTDVAQRMTSTYSNLLRKKELLNEVERFNLETHSLNDQVQSLRKTLTGISDEDQKIINTKSKYDSEENIIAHVASELSALSAKVDDLLNSLELYPAQNVQSGEIENADLLNKITEGRNAKFNEVKALVTQLKATLQKNGNNELDALILQWQELKNSFETKYEAAKSKASSNQSLLDEIRRIELRLTQLSKELNERSSTLKGLGDPETDFSNLQSQWYSLHKQKLELLSNQAKNFTELSKGLIRAEVNKNIATEPLKAQLVAAFQGTRINDTKIQALCDFVSKNEEPLEAWGKVVTELRLLAEIKISREKKVDLPETPILLSCDYNEGNKLKITENFTPQRWLNVATAEIDFNPSFSYTTNNTLGDVIPFQLASAGQQATALLTVLLNQTGAPLIIDQPEDDIDNRAIEEIISNIWNAKKRRQLIFTSHNANLVVNGDAELVICFDYKDSGNQTRGVVKAQGAIDSRTIKDEITLVMEGGRKAFELRRDKLGF